MATSKNKSKQLMDFEIGNSNSKSSISIVVMEYFNSTDLLEYINILNTLQITRNKNNSSCSRSYAAMGRMQFIFCMYPAQIVLDQTDPELPNQAIHQISDRLSENAQNMSTDQFERDIWMQNSFRDLNQHILKESLNPIVPEAFELGDENQMPYRLTGKDGCMLLPGESWIYLLSNSVYENQVLGDITLSIDSHSIEYYNESRMCGGTIQFYHRQTTLELSETLQFFENSTSNTNQEGWIQIHNR